MAAADVVDLSGYAATEYQLDAAAVILDVQPVTHVPTITVDRQGPSLENVDDHERDELLGKLIGTVVVRAIADGRLQAVGSMIGAHEMIGGRLGGRIRRVRSIGAALTEGRSRGRQ